MRPERARARNNVVTFGSGTRPLIFAHGFGCDQTMWRFVTPSFEKDYRVVLFDYVGSGASDTAAFDAARYSSLSGYARDVIEICDALALRDAVFVGHSVSAMIGLLAAIERPEIFSRQILVCPSPRYINDTGYVGGFEREEIEGLLEMMSKNFAGWASFLAPLVMKNAERPELTQELERSFCAVDAEAAEVFARATFLADNREDLAKVQTPALVMQCREDAIAPPEVGDYVHRHLPHSSFVLLQATGHCPHMSHPTETVAAMKDYLDPVA